MRRYAAALGALTVGATAVWALAFDASAEPVEERGSGKCVTDSLGYCDVPHSLGASPTDIQVTPHIPKGWKSYILSVVRGGADVDSFKLRAVFHDGNPKAKNTLWFSYELRGVAEPTPEPTPDPTLDPEPDPGPTPVGDFPSPATTGVPDGTALTVHDGDLYVDTDGQVVDSVHVKGSLVVRAANVTIKNTRVDETVTNQYGDREDGPWTIVDSEVGANTGGKCIRWAGFLNSSKYTAIRVDVRGHEGSFQVANSGQVHIKDSYALPCGNPPDSINPDGSHSDGVHIYCPGTTPCQNVVIEHSTFDLRQTQNFTAPIFCCNGTHNGNPEGLTVKDNLVIGGVYSLYFDWVSGPDYIVHGNRIVDGSWTYGPADTRSTCEHMDWQDNTTVTIDSAYRVTSTVAAVPCPD